MDEFFRTVMGRKFIDGTMPKIAEELARLNKNLEALLELASRLLPPPTGA
jgi:hypothetical protein